jgi:hypothetical protein
VLAALDVVPFEAPADDTYGSLRTRLERAGQPIGGNDLLIAAQAVMLGCTLVTDTEREYSSPSWSWKTGCAESRQPVPHRLPRDFMATALMRALRSAGITARF